MAGRRRAEEGQPRLTDFLHRLAEDPELLERYRKDKARTMQEHGLSEEHQRVMHSGDLKAVRDAVAEEHPRGAHVVMYVT
jgi:hypothetical protein